MNMTWATCDLMPFCKSEMYISGTIIMENNQSRLREIHVTDVSLEVLVLLRIPKSNREVTDSENDSEEVNPIFCVT